MEEADNENVGILVLEAKSLRPFKTKDEYLYAMKEDLAEWFNCLYEDMSMGADNFFDFLETGVLLCQHANRVRCFAEEQKSKGDFAVKSNFVRDIQIPQYDVQFKVDAKRGTFLARDNISNFITWTAKMGIPEVLRFETDDLVLRKNERSVILCLLEVARVGAKFGMLAPTIVQMEAEIDNEIETGEPAPQIKTCDITSLDEMVRELVGRCNCPVQFPITKVGEGKYKIGDNQALVFVRILRKHVMIRVGGGWDTLEHYLDRHDPCRCGFQGSLVGTKATSTARRSTQSAVSKSVSCTSKSPRKLSMTTPLNATYYGSTTHPVVSGIRSISPGPNARTVNLTGKSSLFRSHVVSSVDTNKQTNFTNTAGFNRSNNIKSSDTSDKQRAMSGSGKSSPVKQNISKSKESNSRSTAKMSQASFKRKESSTAMGSQKTSTSSAESGPRSNHRSQSTVSRRSVFPGPVVNGRLRSLSPSSNKSEHSNRTQSVPATNRCSSPIVKQIILSTLRSSREEKIANSHYAQRSPAESSKSEMTTESTNSNFQLEKANTTSVSNVNSDSHCNLSESPGSQSGVESGQHINHSAKNSSTFAKRASNNRLLCGTKCAANGRLMPGTVNTIGKSVQNSCANSKSYLNTFGREYSGVSSASDKTNRPSTLCHFNLTTPEMVFKSKAREQSSSSASKRAACSPVSIKNTPSSVSPTTTKVSTTNENTWSSERSRSSSYSSLPSYETITDDQNGLEIATSDQSIKLLTPLSTESDISLKKNCSSNSDSRSDSSTACSEDGNSSNSARASSEPKEIVSSDIKIYGTRCDKISNVGYAASDTIDCHHCQEVPTDIGDSCKKAIDCHHCQEVPIDIGYSCKKAIDCHHCQEVPIDIGYSCKKAIDCHHCQEVPTDIGDSCKKAEEMVKFTTAPNANSQDKRHGISNLRKLSGTPTHSHLALPITLKMSRKMSLPESIGHRANNAEVSKNYCGQTPGPRKSIVQARAHNTATNKEGSIQAFQNRSTTPGPESDLSSKMMSEVSERRSITPGPYLQKHVNTRSNAATTIRPRLNEALEQTVDNKLSTNKGDNAKGQQKKKQGLKNSLPSRRVLKDQGKTVILVNVDRSKNQHVIEIKDKTNVKSVAKRPKVRDIVNAENKHAKPQNKHIPSTCNDDEYTLVEKSSQGVEHEVYDRTQECLQTAVKQTQVQTKIVSKGHNSRSSVAMTQNSFDLSREKVDDEPGGLEEIDTVLQFPINVPNQINLDHLELSRDNYVMCAKRNTICNE